MGIATLPLWFEPKHNFVGPAVAEWIYVPVGLWHAWFSGRRPIPRPKISQEQNVKESQFYIGMPNIRLLASIIKNKYLRLADPLNPTNLPAQPIAAPLRGGWTPDSGDGCPSLWWLPQDFRVKRSILRFPPGPPFPPLPPSLSSSLPSLSALPPLCFLIGARPGKPEPELAPFTAF